MRLARTLAWACLIAGAAQAQLRVAHDTGLMTAGDVDADGRDDVLILPAAGAPRLYFGAPQHPFLVAGPTVTLQLGTLRDIPVLAGGHLYVPHVNRTIGKGYVDVHALTAAFDLRMVKRHQLDQSPGPGFVNSIKIAPLDRDIDRDGRDDVVAVWGEEPATAAAAAHVAYLSPSRMTATTPIAPLPGQPPQAFVADVHQSFNAFSTRGQFLVAMSSHSLRRTAGGGLGLLWLHHDPRRQLPQSVGGRWFRGAPPLSHHGFANGWSPSSFGAFTSAPRLGTPVVKLGPGPSVLFDPWVLAPYVHPSQAQFLATTAAGKCFDACTADYDGDGRMEMVFCEPHRTPVADFVVIADPARTRAYIQAFDLSRLIGQLFIRPDFAVRGDFDGDGRPDVLLSCAAKAVTGSTFVMLRNDPRTKPGSPPLYFVRGG